MKGYIKSFTVYCLLVALLSSVSPVYAQVSGESARSSSTSVQSDVGVSATGDAVQLPTLQAPTLTDELKIQADGVGTLPQLNSPVSNDNLSLPTLNTDDPIKGVDVVTPDVPVEGEENKDGSITDDGQNDPGDKEEDDPNGMVAADSNQETNQDSGFNQSKNDQWKNLGQPEVSINKLSGAATYNYPIEIPAGRNGFQPALNLQYNSGNQNNFNLYGYGWSLDMGSIQRRGKTGRNNLYKENEFVINLFNDQQVLKPIAVDNNGYGTYGFEREDGSFFQVNYLNNSSWLLKDKFGTTYKFGQSLNGRQYKPTEQNKIFKWFLEEVRDTNDNFMQASYSSDSGQIYPDKIVYTGYGSEAGIFEIQFLKEERTDKLTHSSLQFDIFNKYRISEIQIKIEGKIRRKISLSYTTGGNKSRSLLSSITETAYDENNNAITLPKTELTYNLSPKGWEANKWGVSGQPQIPVAIVASSGIDVGVRFVDVNGDNLTDIVKGNQKYASGGNPEIGVYINNGQSWILDPSWESPGIFVKAGKDTGKRFADVNADGLIDIINSYEKLTTTSTGEPAGVYGGVFVNTGKGWVQDTNWKVPFGIVTDNGADLGVRILDINGDGLVDVIQSYNYSGGKQKNDVYLNDGKQWVKDTSWQYPFLIASGTKTDDGTRFVDVNGDGLVDLVQSVATSKLTVDKPGGSIWLNTGNGWLNSQQNVPVATILSDGSDVGTRFVDINGDGLIDIMQGFRPTANTTTESVYISTGNGWVKSTEWPPPGILADYGGLLYEFVDINGDGLEDRVSSIDFGTSTVGGSGIVSGIGLKKQSDYAGPEDFLIKIKTSEGANTEIKYQSATWYKNQAGEKLNPKTSITIHTVKEVTETDGIGNISTSKYNYEGGEFFVDKTDIYKNRFVGFSKVTLTDPDNHNTVSYFHQGGAYNGSTLGEQSDDYYKTGLLYRSEQYDSFGKLYMVNINKWDSFDLGNARKFVKLTSGLQQTFEGGADHKDSAVNYVYDNTNGNVLNEIDWGEVVGNNDGTFTDAGNDKTTVEKTYATNADKYILATISSQTLKDQQNNKVGENRYYYDGLNLGNVNKGNFTKSENWLDGTNTYLKTINTYTVQGLLESVTNPRGFKTTYIYDSKNLYSVKITNSKNQSSTFTYNLYNGSVQQQTDPNLILTIIEYDAFNRPKKQKMSNAGDVNKIDTLTEYIYQDQTFPRSVEQRYFQDDGSYRITVQYLDGLNKVRQVRESTEVINQFTVKNLSYDKRGDLEKEYLAYTENGSAYSGLSKNSGANTFTYDTRRRPIKISNSLGNVEYKRSPWWMQVVDASGKKKNFFYDAKQNLIKVEELNGAEKYVTEYTYSPLNKLTQIKDAKGNIRTFYYDSLGRLKQQDDLHAPADVSFAVWYYEYDDNGNLTKLVKPEGQNIQYGYDELDRIISEDYTVDAGTEVVYTYDAAKKAVGKLVSVQKKDFAAAYNYDNRGNLSVEQKTLDGQTYQTIYSYDNQNRLKESTLPDSTMVQTSYNLGGQVEKVSKKEPGASAFVDVVKNYDYSPMGQIAKIEYGNGAVTVNTYDPAQMYRLTKKLSTAGGINVQDIAYTFDAVGNITKVVDNSMGIVDQKTIMPKGDVNADQVIDAEDVKCVLLVISWNQLGQKKELTPSCLPRANYIYADLDCNKKLDLTDLRIVNSLSLGKPLPLLIDTDQDGIHNGCEPLTPTVVKYILSPAKTADFTYDDLHRLLSAKVTSAATAPNFNQTFKYDALGNMTYSTMLGNMSYGETAESPYANPHAVTQLGVGTVAPKKVLYNNNGEIINDGNQTLTWDYNGRLLSSNKGGVVTSFSYDHSGQRTKKNSDKYLWTNYEVEASGKIIKYIAEATVETAYGVTAAYYSLDDHLSSASVLLDATGNISQILDYYPYGASRVNKQFGSFDEKKKFTGHELDDETGLYYANARYYNSELGRFYSLDPAALSEFTKFLDDPQQLNFYAYARNNPMKYVDPSGKSSFWDDFSQPFVQFARGLAGAEFNGNTEPERGAYSLGSGISFGVGGTVSVAGAAVAAGGAVVGGTGAVSCGSGVLCLAGAPAITAGAAGMVGGATVSGEGLSLMKDSVSNFKKSISGIGGSGDVQRWTNGRVRGVLNPIKDTNKLTRDLLDTSKVIADSIKGVVQQAGRLSEMYGGSIKNWSKMTTKEIVNEANVGYQIHYFKNKTNGVVKEAKKVFTKFFK